MILDPCTCSVETSRSVSPAQDDDGHSKRARRRVQLDGKAFKREGRVITKLRLHQGPTAKLVHTELATSLTYHLIQSATGYILAANSPPCVILVACIMAVGSRRSSHSYITGASASEDAGLAREDPCRRLAQRAVDLAEASTLLSDTSKAAQEAARLMRLMLFATSPHHPFSATLATHLHNSYQQYSHPSPSSPPSSSPLPEPTTPDELGLYAPEHDAFTAVLHRQPPTISEYEMVGLYGWNPQSIQAAIEVITDPELAMQPETYDPGRLLCLAVLRGVSRIQQTVKSTGHLNLHLLAHDFRNLFRLLDDVELGMSLIAAAEDEAVCEDWGKKLGCYLSSVPMLAEACLAFEATQLGEHEIAKELREETRGRFVRWLKRFIWLTKDAQFTTAEGAHARALMLSLLDVFPGWIETAVDAARQQSASESVGASTSITSNDLHDLLRSLESSSSVFAQSSQQKAALFKALLKYPSYARKHASSAASVVEATLQELK